ncbi:IS110 family transposase [Thermodesulfatator indicus]|uniref:IS110 family transposase n=1 Tax=Thermodesulfatator indicus TaxID=171695 RepID=UPI00315C6BED
MIHPICCGLDVHKRFVSACILKTLPDGSIEVEVREFETFTDDLIALREWLIEKDCPIVAMESTGVYWQPIHNILEGYVEVILVNARHIKNVPGRKTDISDSRWLAELLRVGLLRASYIPPKQVRFWRELVRLRQKHVKTLADYKKRVQKLFESANIKLDNVVSDLFGETGRQIMRLLLETPKPSLEEVRVVLKGNLRRK